MTHLVGIKFFFMRRSGQIEITKQTGFSELAKQLQQSASPTAVLQESAYISEGASTVAYPLPRNVSTIPVSSENTYPGKEAREMGYSAYRPVVEGYHSYHKIDSSFRCVVEGPFFRCVCMCMCAFLRARACVHSFVRLFLLFSFSFHPSKA